MGKYHINMYLGVILILLGLIGSLFLPFFQSLVGILSTVIGLSLSIAGYIAQDKHNRYLVKIVKDFKSSQNDLLISHKKSTKENKTILNQLLHGQYHSNENEKIKNVMRRFRYAFNINKLPLQDMIEKFNKSIRTIVIYAFKNKMVKKRIESKGFRHIGGMGVYVLPPKDMVNIKDSELRSWMNENIIKGLKDATHQIPFAFIIDLRHVFCSQFDDENKRWKTIFQILGIDETFLQDRSVYHFLKESVSMKKIIKLGDINFLLSPSIDDDNQFFIISKNKKNIENAILENLNKAKPFRLEYFQEINENALKKILKKNLRNFDIDMIIKNLHGEVKFWLEFLDNKKL